jgi:hypothetical protein
MPVGDHWMKTRNRRDTYGRLGAMTRIQQLHEELGEIDRMFPGILDEVENAARPGGGEPPPSPPPIASANGTTPPPPLPLFGAPGVTVRRTNSLAGRKQSPETVAKRIATMAKNRAAKNKPPGRRPGRPRKT